MARARVREQAPANKWNTAPIEAQSKIASANVTSISETTCSNAHTNGGVDLNNNDMLSSDVDYDTNSTLQSNSIESASETSEGLHQITNDSDNE